MKEEEIDRCKGVEGGVRAMWVKATEGRGRVGGEGASPFQPQDGTR